MLWVRNGGERRKKIIYKHLKFVWHFIICLLSYLKCRIKCPCRLKSAAALPSKVSLSFFRYMRHVIGDGFSHQTWNLLI